LPGLRRKGLAEREAELMPYFTSGSGCRPKSPTLPYQSKAAIYDILIKASAETSITIAADPKHLRARVGVHRSSHLGHSPTIRHVHMIVPAAVSRLMERMDRLPIQLCAVPDSG
jgi:hypothetical protein